MTWPPFPIDGFVVPSPYARDTATWPPELSSIKALHRHYQNRKAQTSHISDPVPPLKLLPVLFGQGRNLGLIRSMISNALRLPSIRHVEARDLRLRMAKLDLDTAIFSTLYRRYRPHLAIYVNFLIDTISHRCWRYFEPKSFHDSPPGSQNAMKNALTDVYQHMDRHLGYLLRLLPANCVVAILSEHGMAAETESREVGKWRFAIKGHRVKELAGMREDVIPIPIARWIAFRRPDNGTFDKEDVGKLREIIVEETGLPVFNTHFHSENEIVIKLNLERRDYDVYGEDLLSLHLCFGPDSKVSLGEILQRLGPRRSAMHHQDGVFLIKGPGIRPGGRVYGARIVDVAPTLLHASGLDIPAGLDGKVLEVFDSASEIARHQ